MCVCVSVSVSVSVSVCVLILLYPLLITLLEHLSFCRILFLSENYYCYFSEFEMEGPSDQSKRVKQRSASCSAFLTYSSVLQCAY